MIVINHLDLEGRPDEPFEYGGTPRGVLHDHLARLVEDALRGTRWTRMTDEEWFERCRRVAQFDREQPPGCFDVMDVICTNERHALRSDGDVARVSGRQEDALHADDDLFDLLAEIPADTDLHELDADGFRTSLGSRSAFSRLIDRLRRHGIDRSTAVVLLARARPRLVPVDDRLIGTILGLRLEEEPLRYWWWALRHDGQLVAALRRLGTASEQLAGRSLLRVAEAVVLGSAAPAPETTGRR